jgi:hypothetical protein
LADARPVQSTQPAKHQLCQGWKKIVTFCRLIFTDIFGARPSRGDLLFIFRFIAKILLKQFHPLLADTSLFSLEQGTCDFLLGCE